MTYSLSWILPSLQAAMHGAGNFSYLNFLTLLWQELERRGDPGVVRTPYDRMQSGQMFDYTSAPFDLRQATNEAFFSLFRNGYIIPITVNNPVEFPFGAIEFQLSSRGRAWANGSETVPEDAEGYLATLEQLVPNLDSVIKQYIEEAIVSYNRQTYFAAAVMVGAASEKAVYILAESMVNAIQDTSKRNRFQQALQQRALSKLFNLVQATVEDARRAAKSYPTFESADTHMMSVFEAIRVQRNDAVHPLNAQVSSDSVRLSLSSFPHALEKLEVLRSWFLVNPHSIP